MLMKRKMILYIVCFLLLSGLSGCWKEDLKNCWKGDVTFFVLAERFQQPPGGKTEENLALRIDSMRYMLYRGEVIYEQGWIKDPAVLGAKQVALTFPKLPFGEYQLSLLANVEDGEEIVYPGVENTKDYFVAHRLFTMDCDCGFQDFLTLHRSQGVTQFKLKDLPDNITEIEVNVNRLGNVCRTDTTYAGETEITYRVNVADVEKEGVASLLIGTFPTNENTRSEVVLKLYAEGDPNFRVYEQKIGEETVKRNQLLRFEADFNRSIKGEVSYIVTINPKWDGVNDGGEVPVE